MSAPDMVPAAVSPPGAQAVTLAVRGKTRTVDVPPNATVAALFAAVEDELEPSTIKMLCRGKRLAPGDAIPANAKIMVLGTTRAEKETVRSAKSDPLLRGFAAEEAKEAARRGGGGPAQDAEFKFCRFKACDRFDGADGAPHHYDAEKLLRSLAAEVSPIMVRHEWVVGGLIEMDPRDDRLLKQKEQEGGCLLGYNENGGARIYVRLRLPDGAFRERDDLAKTLLHELCHNVVGPHNAAFFALYAQLRTEYLDLRRGAAPARPKAASLADLSDPSKAPVEDVVAAELRREAGNGAINAGERMSAAMIAHAVANAPPAPAAAAPAPAPAPPAGASRSCASARSAASARARAASSSF